MFKPQDIEYSNVLKNRTITGILHLQCTVRRDSVCKYNGLITYALSVTTNQCNSIQMKVVARKTEKRLKKKNPQYLYIERNQLRTYYMHKTVLRLASECNDINRISSFFHPESIDANFMRLLCSHHVELTTKRTEIAKNRKQIEITAAEFWFVLPFIDKFEPNS